MNESSHYEVAIVLPHISLRNLIRLSSELFGPEVIFGGNTAEDPKTIRCKVKETSEASTVGLLCFVLFVISSSLFMIVLIFAYEEMLMM